MSEDKIFVGSAKIITTQFGELMKVSFSQSDLDKLNANVSNGWVNCNVKEKKNKVEGKPTHYLEIDTWKPSGEKASAPQGTNKGKILDDADPLPF